MVHCLSEIQCQGCLGATQGSHCKINIYLGQKHRMKQVTERYCSHQICRNTLSALEDEHIVFRVLGKVTF